MLGCHKTIIHSVEQICKLLFWSYSFHWTRWDSCSYNQCIYLPNFSPVGKMWNKVNFLNAIQLLLIQFSFFLTDCLTKTKEPSWSYYLSIAGGRRDGFMSFPRIRMLCEIQCHQGFELRLLCPFHKMITILLHCQCNTHVDQMDKTNLFHDGQNPAHLPC